MTQAVKNQRWAEQRKQLLICRISALRSRRVALNVAPAGPAGAELFGKWLGRESFRPCTT
jgi:hypothetical protein